MRVGEGGGEAEVEGVREGGGEAVRGEGEGVRMRVKV